MPYAIHPVLKNKMFKIINFSRTRIEQLKKKNIARKEDMNIWKLKLQRVDLLEQSSIHLLVISYLHTPIKVTNVIPIPT
jgi:hypothetical protein